MYAMIAFDTEDVYYPPEAGIDDIPGWLAGIMTEEGITGTFFVMGEKAESLLARGRRDVLEKMAAHDIASHQQGNRYPLLPQVVEGKGWNEGMEAVREYEDWVEEQLVRAFGKKPVAFSRHNSYFAPQHLGVAGERSLSYMYMINQIPAAPDQPFWYAGALTFPDRNSFAGFDRIYTRDEIFEARMRELDAFIEQKLEEGAEWTVVFGCHPVQVMARGWLEHHALVSGRARSPEQIGWRYRTKPRAEEARAQANFRKLCQYLKDHPDVEVVGIEEAARLFSAQPGRIGRDALIAYARQMVEQEQIPFHTTFSPAELVCGFADSLIQAGSSGDLPEEVDRRQVLGPVERPVVAQEKVEITREEIASLCRQLIGHVEEEGHLPAHLDEGGERVGVSQIAFLTAKAYLAQAQYDQYDRLSVPFLPRYPQIAFEIDAWIRRHIGEHWAMPLDFSCEDLAEQARLQTWSMKPAWLRPPQGKVAEGIWAGRERVEG